MTTNNDNESPTFRRDVDLTNAVPFPAQGGDVSPGQGSAYSVTPRLSSANNSPQSITPQGSPDQGHRTRILDSQPSQKHSDDALTNSSSKESRLTSSDKLSALPPPASPPTRHRAFRRSLDAPASTSISHSMPVFPHGSSTTNDLTRDASFSSLPANNGTFPRNSNSGNSFGKETPKQRVSLESDRISLPTFQSVRQAFSRSGRGSEAASSPGLHPQDARSPSLRQKELPSESPNLLSSRSPSNSRSRAASPLRFLQQWSANFRGMHTREEPFVPVNPFKTGWKFHIPAACSSCFCGHPTDEEVGITPELYQRMEVLDHSCEDALPTCLPPRSSVEAALQNTRHFLTESFPRLVYIYFLLRLPALYFSRVARIFQDAEVSKPDIQRMCEGGVVGSGFVPHTDLASSGAHAETARRGAGDPAPRGALASGLGFTAHVSAAAAAVPMPLPYPDEWTPPLVSPALVRFKNSWEAFVDSLLREWKTLNLVSALLLSAIMTMFQVPDAAYDPLTRTAALISLVCALMSLSYGCIYIVRFGTMRSMYRASRWADEARKSYTLIWWNAWVMLAMPGVWLAWSMISFIVCILSFVWRTGSTRDPHERDPMSPNAILGPRIAITCILGLGLVYFALIIRTLKSYGAHGEKEWRGRGGGEGLRGGETRRGGDGRGGEREREGMGERVRDAVDAAMERRGRERERSQRRHRRRERRVEVDKRREHGDGGRGGDASLYDNGVSRGEVGGGTLGLGLIGVDEPKGDVEVKESVVVMDEVTVRPLARGDGGEK